MADSSNQVRVGVIMAGGSGERFWPLSRRLRPKQLLPLTHPEHNMLEEAVARLTPLIEPERIHVITGAHLLEPIRSAGVGIPPENVIAEPCKRNTAGALAYAAAHLLAKYGGDGDQITMAITTADHQIGPGLAFSTTIEAALEAAEAEDALVTLGVTPDRPETGYGYIQATGTPVSLPSGRTDVSVCRVAAFHEKPNRERAEQFLEEGGYFWNSGMFFWRVSTFLKQLEVARPVLADAVREIAEAIGRGDEEAAGTIFANLESISIDYALMEHAEKVLMARADFPWDDVGAWPALYRSMQHDETGNVCVGDPVLVDCEDCIVYNNVGAEKQAVAVVGMEDVVVVCVEDAVLVMPKDRAQDVRRIVRELEERGHSGKI